MRLDIENKILIPFLIIIIISILAVGIVSYQGSYRLFLESKLGEMQEDVEEIVRVLDYANTHGETGHADILAYIRAVKGNSFIILDGSGSLVHSDYHLPDGKALLDRLEQAGAENYFKVKLAGGGTENLYLFKYIPEKDWYVGTGIMLDSVTSSLLEIQKYTILVAIIFAIIAVELTIAIAHNLSKPIKKLAEICNKIAQGDFRKKLDFNRRDEIGILAQSFNHMIKKIEHSTEELKRLKEIKEDILRSTTTGIITIDNTGSVISVNRAAEDMLRNGASVRNEEIFETIVALSKRALDTGEQINELLRFSHEGEEEKVIEINTSFLTTEKGDINGALCSFNDISARKKIEEKMEQIDRLTSLGELAAGLAHEIRNPLAGMKTSSQVLIKRLKENESAVAFLEKINSEIDRMNKLITDILNFAKPREPRFEITEVSSLLAESVSLMEEHIKRSHITIRNRLPKEKHRVMVDRSQFKQILINLFMNAVKAMSSGGKLLIFGRPSRDGRSFNIVIADTGKGIPVEIQERIFDPFFTTDSDGTGLGLSVVKRLVMQNNGEIRVSSRVGRGTRFVINLPLYQKELAEDEKAYYYN